MIESPLTWTSERLLTVGTIFLIIGIGVLGTKPLELQLNLNRRVRVVLIIAIGLMTFRVMTNHPVYAEYLALASTVLIVLLPVGIAIRIFRELLQ